jgi:hypothetical protein
VQEKLLELFGRSEEAQVFLTQIRRLKARYARDQFSLIEKTLQEYGQVSVEKALNYCITNSLFSAVEFKNAASYFGVRIEKELEEAAKLPNVKVLNTAANIARKRPLSEYARVAKGGGI